MSLKDNLQGLYRGIPRKIFVSRDDFNVVSVMISDIYFLKSVEIEVDPNLTAEQMLFEWYDGKVTGIESMYGDITRFLPRTMG